MRQKHANIFPLLQARSLKGMQDNTSTQIAELREMMTKIMQHFQQEVASYDNVINITYSVSIGEKCNIA